MTAAADALDHAQGFLAALSPAGDLDLDRAPRIGEHWHIVERGLSIKRYPACYCVHRLVDGQPLHGLPDGGGHRVEQMQGLSRLDPHHGL